MKHPPPCETWLKQLVLGSLLLLIGCSPSSSDHENRIRKLESEIAELRKVMAASDPSPSVPAVIQSETVQPGETSAPTFSGHVGEWIAEMQPNPAVFTARYGNKMIKVIGTVSFMNTEGFRLDTVNEGRVLGSVQCVFQDRDLATLAGVTAGSTNTVIGTYRGRRTALNDLLLEDCRLVTPSSTK